MQSLTLPRVLPLAGANTRCATPNGQTPLYLAAKFGRVDEARLLLAAVNDLGQYCDCNNRSPLHVAAAAGNASVLQEILQPPAAPAAVDTVDVYGRTPLILAAHGGYVECIRALLAEVSEQGQLFSFKDSRDFEDFRLKCLLGMLDPITFIF